MSSIGQHESDAENRDIETKAQMVLTAKREYIQKLYVTCVSLNDNQRKLDEVNLVRNTDT